LLSKKPFAILDALSFNEDIKKKKQTTGDPENGEKNDPHIKIY